MLECTKISGWICLLLLSLSSCKYLPPLPWPLESELERLATPAWRNLDQSAILFRLVAAQDGNEDRILLGQRSTGNELAPTEYSYDVASMRLTPLSTSAAESQDLEWREIVGVGISRGLDRSYLCRSDSREGLRVASVCVLPYGKNLAAAGMSDSGKYIYIVSADGPHRVYPPSVWGSGGETIRCYGQHYIELISIESSAIVGRPIPIGIETARDNYVIDWSDSNSHIVIAPRASEWLAVVSVKDFMTRRGDDNE